MNGGRGGIRTPERRSGRIYSPHPLATWIPYRKMEMLEENSSAGVAKPNLQVFLENLRYLELGGDCTQSVPFRHKPFQVSLATADLLF